MESEVVIISDQRSAIALITSAGVSAYTAAARAQARSSAHKLFYSSFQSRLRSSSRSVCSVWSSAALLKVSVCSSQIFDLRQ